MRRNNSRGLTLTELLLATVMITIVMAGVAVWTTSIKQMRQTSQTTRYTDMKLAAVMKAIRKDAELAIGDTANPGIQTNTAGATRSICFRHDTQLTPADYTDDIWACWYHHNSSPGLRRCYDTPAGDVPPDSNTKCDNAASTRDYYTLDDIDFFTVTNDVDGKLENVTISLTAHDDRSSTDALKNPSKTVVARISPYMISR